ncbi:MAG: hypothetical protein EXR69_02500 [Myxococcales bacterium]|nr:hypothetical protein [Myxococcales bacterium]
MYALSLFFRVPLVRAPLALLSTALLAVACRTPGETKFITDIDNDGVSEEEDCDDSDPNVGAGNTYYVDADGDSYGDPESVETLCAVDGGYSGNSDDCDDADANVHPGVEDPCDGIDQDCDGDIDDGAVASTWYVDGDGDGYGDDSTATEACDEPVGAVSQGGDCDDGDADYNPGASEEDCEDPNDYNCDGSVGYDDVDGDGFPACAECDDADDAIHPDAPEVCNGADDDCDALVDDADDSVDTSAGATVYADLDGDGYGDPGSAATVCEPGAGWVTNSSDCDDGRADVNPGAQEICDGIDDDCDTLIDDADDSVDASTGSSFYSDGDGDGYGEDATLVWACEAPADTVAVSGDCDDSDSAYNPAADESDCTDPADYNCDGSTGYEDVDGDGYAACAECDDSSAANFPGADEVCDGVDNNCDSVVDEATATDAGSWYADADSDSFGDPDSSTVSCDAPAGSVADWSDCDDADGSVSPAAVERCNGIDDNCDGTVDESTSADAATWYGDADSDGYGDRSDDSVSCAQPAGYVGNDDDCDGADGAVHPGADEYCNSTDDNCDGSVDEDAALDAGTWYADTDADRFGAGAGVVDCAQPSGYVSNADDCEDTAAAVNPDAAEVCNAIDDNCDSQVDEGLDAMWYADTDGDSYGDADLSVANCSAPPTYVTDSTDCDDGDDAVNPAAAEVCNEIDDDCDTLVDEGVTSTSYADADGDSYGDPNAATVACSAPAGDVSDSTDCDDTDADVHPGAVERGDGVDEDCDGSIDDGAYHGTGADGPLTVTGTTTLGDASVVTALSGTTLTVEGTPLVSAGDEVLVINMHGSDAEHTHVGNYEFLWVASVSGSDIVLDYAPSVTFGETTNADLTGQAVQVVRVPQYTDVTVATGGVLNAPVWDGATGGILAFRATGTVTVDSGGLIEVDEAGYAAGETGPFSNGDGYQGESYAGAGDGGLDSSCSGVYCNYTYGYYVANYGGGGAMITGGGGNHGGGATAGDSWYLSAGYPGSAAGDTYGAVDLSTLYAGSGGAGVWNSNESNGPGGDGAGVVYIGAESIVASDAASISAMGGDTESWAHGSWYYGAGGGAGGTIWLTANTLSLASGAVDATGGLGNHTPGGEAVAASNYRAGGDGGYGRVRLDYNTINGLAAADGAAASEAVSVSEPDAGYSATP